jgi:hypothetical protein
MSAGTFYVIQLEPDLNSGRVKLGWSSNVGYRLRAHQTVAPLAVLRMGWTCDRSWERDAIRYVTREDCTRLSAEVFDVRNLAGLLKAGGEFFSVDRLTPKEVPIICHEPIPNPLTMELATEYARDLGKLPKTKVERECIVCGKKFMGTKRALYCSRAHASKAWRDAKKAPTPTAPPTTEPAS